VDFRHSNQYTLGQPCKAATTYARTTATETKAWCRHLLHHEARPILQHPGPALHNARPDTTGQSLK